VSSILHTPLSSLFCLKTSFPSPFPSTFVISTRGRIEEKKPKEKEKGKKVTGKGRKLEKSRF